MTYELVIEADCNDGDTVSRTTVIDDADLQRFKPVFDAIVAKTKELKVGPRRGHNFWTFDFTRGGREIEYNEMYASVGAELIEEFYECFVPHGVEPNYGIHTIESIVYYPKPVKTVIL